MSWDELSIEQRHMLWLETERQIRALTNALESVLSLAEVGIIQDFVDHNEYGLALESLYDDLIEEPRSITMETVEAIQEVASRMKLQSRKWSELRALTNL